MLVGNSKWLTLPTICFDWLVLHVLHDLNIEDFKFKPSDCSCVSSPFIYNPVGHLISGDFKIIKYTCLRDVFANTTQTRQHSSWFEIIVTKILQSTSRYGRPLRNISISIENGSFPFPLNIYRTWLYLWVTRRKYYKKQGTVNPSLSPGFTPRLLVGSVLLIVILFCVVMCLFVLFVFVLCLFWKKCCQCLWIVYSWFSTRFYLTHISNNINKNITSHLYSLNIKRLRHMPLKMNVLTWDRHKRILMIIV